MCSILSHCCLFSANTSANKGHCRESDWVNGSSDLTLDWCCKTIIWGHGSVWQSSQGSAKLTPRPESHSRCLDLQQDLQQCHRPPRKHMQKDVLLTSKNLQINLWRYKSESYQGIKHLAGRHLHWNVYLIIFMSESDPLLTCICRLGSLYIYFCLLCFGLSFQTVLSEWGYNALLSLVAFCNQP